jgi:transcriptional regulator GlxA family with amidase domain
VNADELQLAAERPPLEVFSPDLSSPGLATWVITVPASITVPSITPARRELATVTVQRAVAFIEKRAQENIGVADIAAAACVTVRAVQLAFRRHLGTTPMRYLRQVRLGRAHEQLLTADPARTTVTRVAADWGFANPGRFTSYYRAAYGIPPRQTLHQRR